MEIPVSSALNLFIGKTISKMDASCANNIEFLFTDGSKVALHIEVDNMGLPDITACTHCVELS